ncbi:hypothetical protein HU200_032539 [Digitaria exilis]|uniref:Aromatic amino acid beta-eliminating lyase/threonine aldolase domain-containing protein n=1 Tax=Digitaria exilis TaxID=1010633 RepID=A0A835BT27_9POAL|nr:hypothetical protein HU200_032539 [Digitaria exilis]
MASKVVDLRSDTVTKPSEAMRAAMAAADVDDDVVGVDPTAQRFQAEMAALMGKEAALFVPSGTMGNLISVLVHCDVRGSEVILGDNSHIHVYENGGISTIGGVHPKTVRNNPDGTMDLDKIVAAIRHQDLHYPTTRLICLENTQGNCGGKCLSVEYTDKVGEIAKNHGLKLHIDGARIFNASVALGVPVDRLVKAADSVSVCLSKGLGAPVGSVIVGSKAFIGKAKILRKTLGGGMRQVGVLCAAAHVAVRDTLGKLADDHRKAKVLADSASVETNMVCPLDHLFDPLKFYYVIVLCVTYMCFIRYSLISWIHEYHLTCYAKSWNSTMCVQCQRVQKGEVPFSYCRKAVEELLKGGSNLEHLTNGAAKSSYGH